MLVNILETVLILSALAERSSQLDVNLLEEHDTTLDPKSFEKVGEVYYYFGKEKVTWYEALAKCRSVGGFLASFDEPSEATSLSDHLVKTHSSTDDWWLSGADLDKEDDFYWYGTGEAFNTTYFSKEQTDTGNCLHYRYKQIGYKINEYPCLETSRYICEFEKPKTVKIDGPNDTSADFKKVGDKFYYFSRDIGSWFKAYLNCRSMGSNLATINGPSELQQFQNYIFSLSGPFSPGWYWVSGAKFNETQNFFWYGTGKEFAYVNWSPFVMDEVNKPYRCTQLYYDEPEFVMDALPCNEQWRYICETTNLDNLKTIS